MSISGLPPFNGFISEFLVYFAAFQALNYTHATLLLAILAIISLAAIGGLASFCFTKVVGIVFLGEPRTAQAARAEEASRWLTAPLVILAGLCLAIGLFPENFIHLAFAGLTDVVRLGPVQPAMIERIGANLALGSRLFLLIFMAVLLVRKLLYRNKVIATGPTWGCGFTRPTARIQYTGTSYVRSVISFFRPFALVRETEVRLQRIFPGRTEYQSRVEDIAEVGLHLGLALPLLALLLLVIVSLFMVLLTENSRVPVDDPNTHLELTMIDEVMILDHSGPDLALIELGSFYKLFFYAAFIFLIVCPLNGAWGLVNVPLFFAGVGLVYVAIGLVESGMARFKMNLVPKFILTSLISVFFAAILTMEFVK